MFSNNDCRVLSDVFRIKKFGRHVIMFENETSRITTCETKQKLTLQERQT